MAWLLKLFVFQPYLSHFSLSTVYKVNKAQDWLQWSTWSNKSFWATTSTFSACQHDILVLHDWSQLKSMKSTSYTASLSWPELGTAQPQLVDILFPNNSIAIPLSYYPYLRLWRCITGKICSELKILDFADMSATKARIFIEFETL